MKPKIYRYTDGNVIANRYFLELLSHGCLIKLYGNYHTGAQPIQEESIYHMIIKSEDIQSKISVTPKNNTLYFLEKTFRKKPSKYNKTKSDLTARLFNRTDFLKCLEKTEVYFYSNFEAEIGRIFVNPVKKYLTINELKNLLKIGIILSEEIGLKDPNLFL